jgi:hypothetical protein
MVHRVIAPPDQPVSEEMVEEEASGPGCGDGEPVAP